MPNAIITGTASNFGTIAGTLAGEQGTVAGTITAAISGTLTGSVGVPGPQGPTGPTGATGPQGPAGQGVPAGGTTGQVLKKASATSYDTVWGTDQAAVWGGITGTITDQGDLTAYVAAQLAGGTAVAKNLEVYVRNQTGSTLTAGTIVYINGATGNRPTVTKAQANNDANSAQTFGFLKENIANNGFGYVIVRGELENVNTSALTEGQQLYLSPTTAGTWTTTKPSAPNHLVYVGICVRAHPTQGIILVAIQNGYELDELHDVQIVSPTNGQVLKYDSAQGLWVNGTDSAPVTSVAGKTGAVTLSNTDISGLGTMATATASDYLAKAGNLSGLADLATSRTNLGLGTMAVETASNYLTTSAASSTYLTQANAASTYQTQAGMSSYLTTSSAASTYQTQAGMSSYLTTSAASSTYAPLSSAALSGTPTAPTASANTNTTQLATTAFVLGQGNTTSATIAMNGTQAAGSSNLYARADHVHPTDTTLAPKASPALTGTPTAPTAAAATNTTQIATTAFVQQEVPAASTTAAGKVELTTDAEAQTASSTTLALSASSALNAIHSQSYFRATAVGWGAATSGTGSGATTISGTVRVIAPTTAVGYAIANVQPSGHSRGTVGGTGGTSAPFDWSKRFVGRCRFTPRTLGTDSNTVWRVNWGKTTSTTTGDLAVRGVGFKQAASGVLVLQVHNGTTLTSVNTSTTPATNTWYDVRIESDGAGNVTLFINDSSAATSSAGPTAGSGTNANFVTVEAENLNTITGTNNSLFVSELTMMFSIA